MKGENKMFLQQGLGAEVGGDYLLMARLTKPVVSSQVVISVTYNAVNPNNPEGIRFGRSDAIHTTNNTTPVTLLTHPPVVNWVNTIEFIKIYNPDTQANTVQLLAGFEPLPYPPYDNDIPIYSCTVNPGETLMISETGLTNISAEGGSNMNFETDTNNIHMDGMVSVGTSNNTVRADHVHPSDTTKANSALENRHYVGNVGEPQFQNGWQNFGSQYTPAAFYKDNFGIVHLEGLISSGSTNAIIFTLPSGYIPNAITHVSTLANHASANIVINPDGTVFHDGGSNVWFSLNSITFRP